jgi:hypothetical protein
VDSVLYDTKTQKMQFTCWRSAHEILLGEFRYNFGCGYTYGTRFHKRQMALKNFF